MSAGRIVSSTAGADAAVNELVGVDTSGYADQQVTFGFAAGISGMDAGRDVTNEMFQTDSQFCAAVLGQANKFRSSEHDPWGLFGVLMNIGGPTFENLVAAQGVAAFLKKFPTNGEWDMKVYLAKDYGYESGFFYLHDDQGRVVRSDVFGNVMYGSMLAHWDVHPDTALGGANLGTQAGIDAGKGDDPLDDRAVQFGYDLYKRYPNGLSEKQFYEEVANARLTD
ncbi:MULTISPECIES: polymorphic toxin type 44 domain-containing protein [unclassified Leifsonia]|uniref:polymorphic toxin type 44 domain-containing protein n=1 Tax=unclassified Leifsonia TaxID=2663824 RepID=UPI0008A78595|nr:MULTISPECIES: polymorphic toxin type 44 domain-containing protein [unclassified Leifsonia]SEH56690.1 toxin 44 [Leifsonia sp. CL154]SFL22186.1 toxin 44 [Leifsonia sp. CL147]